MNTFLALLVFGLTACTHAPANDAEIAGLAKPAAEERLAEVLKKLSGIEERVDASRTRRDNAQFQASSNVTKQTAVEGTEAELDALQQKRAALLHEEHALEARLRELAN